MRCWTCEVCEMENNWETNPLKCDVCEEPNPFQPQQQNEESQPKEGMEIGGSTGLDIGPTGIHAMGWVKNCHEDHMNGGENFQAFGDIDDMIIEKTFKDYEASDRKDENKRFAVLNGEIVDFDRMIVYPIHSQDVIEFQREIRRELRT